MERAMGIEPKRPARPKLETKRFGAMADPKCDWSIGDKGLV
jgi:hypothetical protein